MTKSKVSRITGLLFRLNKFLPTNVLQIIYQSLLHPYLTYENEAWYTAPLYLINKLFVIQKKKQSEQFQTYTNVGIGHTEYGLFTPISTHPRIFHPKIGKIFTPFNIFTPGFFTPMTNSPPDFSPP